MAIRIIQGVPGSGKTYYAVRHLAKHYCQQTEDGTYYLKDDVTVFTNIDSFKPDHHDLAEAVRKAGGADEFFNLENQRALTESIGGQIIYIIDEAQRYWRKGDRGHHQAYEYFELHRHLGHDIYLVTQNARKLPGDLVCLAEYLIDAAPRTRSMIGEMKYKWLSDGEIIKREAWKPEQAIFDLYKSMDMGEAEKTTNPVIRTVVSVFVVVFFIVGGGLWYFKTKWGSHKPSTATEQPPVSSAPAPVTPVHPLASNKETLTVPVSMLSETKRIGGFEQSIHFVIFQDVVYPKNLFPYPLRKLAGQWWTDVPASLVQAEQKEEKQNSRESQPARASAYASPSVAAHAPGRADS